MNFERYTIPEQDAFKLYQGGLYIVTYSHVYSVRYSANAGGCYCPQIYHNPTRAGLVKRGTWQAATAEQVNEILGFNLLIA